MQEERHLVHEIAAPLKIDRMGRIESVLAHLVSLEFSLCKEILDEKGEVGLERPSYYKRNRNRVDLQASILVIFILIASCMLIFFVNYSISYKSMILELRNRATSIYEYMEAGLNKDSFFILNQKEDNTTKLYQDTKEQLENVKSAAGVRYLYTAKRTQQGEFIYLVDGLPSDSSDFRYVGDPIEVEIIPDMERALSGETVFPDKIKKTTWGSIFISYFPMHDDNKNVIGVMGIEFDAKQQYAAFRNMAITTVAVILLFCLIASLVAVRMFKRISNPSFRDVFNSDCLTGLKNRNSFELDLYNLEQSPNRTKTGIVSIDLDKLKQVNDTYGHDEGDQYIRTACKIIQEHVSPPDVLYRIGGDEFVIIVRKSTEKEVEKLLGRIEVAARKRSENSSYPISISTGFAFFDIEHDDSLFETLKRSDARMYIQKREKKLQQEEKK